MDCASHVTSVRSDTHTHRGEGGEGALHVFQPGRADSISPAFIGYGALKIKSAGCEGHGKPAFKGCSLGSTPHIGRI